MLFDANSNLCVHTPLSPFAFTEWMKLAQRPWTIARVKIWSFRLHLIRTFGTIGWNLAGNFLPLQHFFQKTYYYCEETFHVYLRQCIPVLFTIWIREGVTCNLCIWILSFDSTKRILNKVTYENQYMYSKLMLKNHLFASELKF